MTHKVAFLDVMDAKVQDEIRSALPPGFSIQFAETGDRREHMAMVADADFILTAVAVDAEMIRAAPKLKLLHKWGIGVDKFDLDAARAARIPVAITVRRQCRRGVRAHRDADARRPTAACRWPIASCARANGSARRFARKAYQLSGKTVGHCSASAMSAAWWRIASPAST